MANDSFSDAVLSLHQASLDAKLWPAVLSKLETLTDSVGMVINFVPKTRARCGFTLTGSFGQGLCAEYSRTYMPLCLRVRLAVRRPELRLTYDALLGLSGAEMDRDSVYRWLGEYGLRDYLGATLGGSKEHHWMMSLQRTREQGHVQRPRHRTLGKARAACDAGIAAGRGDREPPGAVVSGG